MHVQMIRVSIVAIAALAMLQGHAAAAPIPANTIKLKVNDMHCKTCAKKIARKLYAVPGVVKVAANLKTHTALVTPQKQRNPSPRAMWEAVEKAGFKPVSLEVRGQKFKKKPAR